MPTPRPALSCRSCGSFEALPGGELCPACRHAVEVHGASFVDAYAVPCEGCDRPQIQTSPETPIACRSCGSPACEWPGECDTSRVCPNCGRERMKPIEATDDKCPGEGCSTVAQYLDSIREACGSIAEMPATEDLRGALRDLEADLWALYVEPSRAIRDRLVVK